MRGVTLNEIRAAGCNVSVDETGTRIKLTGAASPELVARARACRAELLRAALREAVHAKLLRLAEQEFADVGLVKHLDDDEIEACDGHPDEILVAYVRALADSREREAGRRPQDEQCSALCAHCGEVWVHASVVAVAPKVDGVARLQGCPWCHTKNRQTMSKPK